MTNDNPASPQQKQFADEIGVDYPLDVTSANLAKLIKLGQQAILKSNPNLRLQRRILHDNVVYVITSIDTTVMRVRLKPVEGGKVSSFRLLDLKDAREAP